MRPAGKAGDRTRDRGGDDDPASGGFLQVGHAGFHGEERALQIGGEHCVPLLGRHVLDPRLRKDPGIGAEHVDAAIPPRRALRHLLQLGDVGHVGYGVARIAAEFLRRGFRLGVVPRDDRDLRAVPGEDYLMLRINSDNRSAPFS